MSHPSPYSLSPSEIVAAGLAIKAFNAITHPNSSGIINFTGSNIVITAIPSTNTVDFAVSTGTVVWIDRPSNTTVAKNTGSFITFPGVILTLPSSGSLSNGDLCMFYMTTSGAFVIQAGSGQKIALASSISSVGGSMTSSTGQGSAASLIFQTSTSTWFCNSSTGLWSIS